jgi:hypothetical protein
MPIPVDYHAQIQQINVDEHCVDVNYLAYANSEYFLQNPDDQARLNDIEAVLTAEFNRADLVNLYDSPIEAKTKFLATMIWGYAAPAVGINQEAGQANNAGPFRVGCMMASLQQNPGLLDDLAVDNNIALQHAYAAHNHINWCGPNFFTKHLYFLGKSQGLDLYPVIFDNRVALGLAHVSLGDVGLLEMIGVTARASWHAYQAYLEYVHNEMTVIECQPDQIEYFLFNVAAGN